MKHGQHEKYYDALVSKDPRRILQADFEPDAPASDPVLQDARGSSKVAAAGRFRVPEFFWWGGDIFKHHKPGKGQLMGSL